MRFVFVGVVSLFWSMYSVFLSYSILLFFDHMLTSLPSWFGVFNRHLLELRQRSGPACPSPSSQWEIWGWQGASFDELNLVTGPYLPSLIILSFAWYKRRWIDLHLHTLHISPSSSGYHLLFLFMYFIFSHRVILFVVLLFCSLFFMISMPLSSRQRLF